MFKWMQPRKKIIKIMRTRKNLFVRMSIFVGVLWLIMGIDCIFDRPIELLSICAVFGIIGGVISLIVYHYGNLAIKNELREFATMPILDKIFEEDEK